MDRQVSYTISEKANWHQRIPLTIKMIVFSALIGLAVWAAMDYIQSNKLKEIFYVQLLEELTEQSMDYRLRMDRYIRSHHESVEFFVTQSKFSAYIAEQNWSSSDSKEIIYHQRPPTWYPKTSLLRILARPRHAILLDADGRIREIYSRRKEAKLPQDIVSASPLIVSKSLDQSLVADIENRPYVITSDSLYGTDGNLKATLMLVSPVDEEFLVASTGFLRPGYSIALITLEQEPRIAVSSNQNRLPVGMTLKEAEDDFLITGQHTYNYGAAEYMIKLVSFTSKEEVKRLTVPVIATGRHQRNIIAPVLILTFTAMMAFISFKIGRLNRDMSRFSEETLGEEQQHNLKGDKLFVLETLFHRLTGKVIEAQELLKREANEKTRMIVKNAFDAIVTLDSEGNILTWNPQAEHIFGLTDEAAAGKNFIQTVFPSAYRDLYSGIFRNYIQTGDSYGFNRQIEATAIHHNGHTIPVELTITPAEWEGNFFFIATIRDIRERKKAETELKKFKFFSDRSNDAHFLLQRDARFIYVNKTACRLLGYTEKELLSLTVPDVDVIYDLPRFQTLFDHIQKETIAPIETTNKSKDGNTFPSEIMVTGYQIGSEQYMFASLRDISERKKSENQIKTSLREKEVLLREVHHRVKNNMQVISSLLTLQATQTKDANFTHMMNDSQNRIKSMALVHEKLYRSHNLANIDFNDYIQTLTRNLFAFYRKPEGNISLTVSADDVLLAVDTAIPCGLLINELVSNSLQHAFPDGKEGSIDIHLTKEERETKSVYQLTVSDNGIGIPEGLDIRNTKTLGLQLITTLVEHQLQGTLELKRSAGTEFRISFREASYKQRV